MSLSWNIGDIAEIFGDKSIDKTEWWLRQAGKHHYPVEHSTEYWCLPAWGDALVNAINAS